MGWLKSFSAVRKVGCLDCTSHLTEAALEPLESRCLFSSTVPAQFIGGLDGLVGGPRFMGPVDRMSMHGTSGGGLGSAYSPDAMPLAAPTAVSTKWSARGHGDSGSPAPQIGGTAVTIVPSGDVPDDADGIYSTKIIFTPPGGTPTEIKTASVVIVYETFPSPHITVRLTDDAKQGTYAVSGVYCDAGGQPLSSGFSSSFIT